MFCIEITKPFPPAGIHGGLVITQRFWAFLARRCKRPHFSNFCEDLTIVHALYLLNANPEAWDKVCVDVASVSEVDSRPRRQHVRTHGCSWIIRLKVCLFFTSSHGFQNGGDVGHPWGTIFFSILPPQLQRPILWTTAPKLSFFSSPSSAITALVVIPWQR